MNASRADWAILLLAAMWSLGPVAGEEILRQEIPSRFAPPDLVKRTVQAQLSAAGRFVLLPEKGTVLVIDEPARVMAAMSAMEKLEIPPPHIQMSIGLETGGKSRPSGGRMAGPARSDQYVPFPSGYLPPRVSSNGGGGYVVLPAHPTGFRRRVVGQGLEISSKPNPDGSITLDLNAENVEFSGFVPYGSPALTLGVPTVIPLSSGLRDATPFKSYLSGMDEALLTETVQFATSLVVTPELEGNQVHLHLLPQLRIDKGGTGSAEDVPLRDLATGVRMPPGKAVRLPGFAGAPPDFNQKFFVPKGNPEGLTRIVLKVTVRPIADSR